MLKYESALSELERDFAAEAPEVDHYSHAAPEVRSPRSDELCLLILLLIFDCRRQ